MRGNQQIQRIGVWGALCGALLLFVPAVHATGEVPVEVTLSQTTAEVGDTVELGLMIQNAQGVPAPELPPIDGVRSQYLGPSTMMSFVNGKMSSSLTHRYLLVMTQPGTVTIGPLSFLHQGTRYTVPPRTVTVVSRGQPLPPATGGTDREEHLPGAGLEERIFLRVIPEKETGVVNERIPVTIKLYVRQVSIQDVQYPRLEGTGYVHEGFGKPRQTREEFGGNYYDVIAFRTALAATREGVLPLENVQLQCTLLVRQERRTPGRDRDFFGQSFFEDSFIDNFFGRFQSFPYQVEAPPVRLTILPFPRENIPADFKGAVGRYELNVRVSPREVAAGDPLTVRMEIAGTGNLDSVTSPVLEDPAAFKVYQPESSRQGQLRVFEQVIIPLSEQVREIPPISFSFFDPEQKKYITRRQGPFPVTVTPAAEKKAEVVAAAEASPGPAARTEIIGRDIVFMKENPGKLSARDSGAYRHPGFWLLQLLPLAGIAAAAIIRRRRERMRQDIRYARKLRAPGIARQGIARIRRLAASGEKEAFYDAVSKTLREYLGHRFNRSSAGITGDVVDELMAHRELDETLGERVGQCFAACDAARYAAAEMTAADLTRTRDMVEHIIDALERSRR